MSRATPSLTEWHSKIDDGDIWSPSLQQPGSTCLGDFLKLLGRPIRPDHSKDDYHNTTGLVVPIADQYNHTFEQRETSL